MANFQTIELSCYKNTYILNLAVSNLSQDPCHADFVDYIINELLPQEKCFDL